jgi:DNA ligase (NAD+)
VARLQWLGGRHGLRLHGVGPATWQALLRAGLLHGLLDWMTLTPAQMAAAPGFGAPRASRLAHVFAAAHQRPFASWMRALGLPGELPPGITDWATLQGESAARTRGQRAFLQQPAVQRLAAQLHAARVRGF